MGVKAKPIIYYIPCEHAELDGSWFDYPNTPFAQWNNMPLMRHCAESSGYEFKVTDGADYLQEADLVEKVIVFNMPYYNDGKYLPAIPSEKKVIFIWEPPSTVPWLYDEMLHDQFSKVFTWQDDLVDNKRYFKFFYQNLAIERTVHTPFGQRKLCSMINRNKTSEHDTELYSERRRVIDYFESLGTDEFTLYGQHWNKEEHPSFAGSIEDKVDTLENYRFSFCYENMSNIEGYVSEKIFDCMAAGCIPIYLGASNVSEFIPADCYIDRDSFSNIEDLHQFLKNMSEETFSQYHARFAEFFKSDQALLFSARNFAEIFMKHVLERDMHPELYSQLGPNLIPPARSYSRKPPSARPSQNHRLAPNRQSMKVVHLAPGFAAEHPYNLQLVDGLRMQGLHVRVVRSRNFYAEISNFNPAIIHIHWLHSFTETDADEGSSWSSIRKMVALFAQLYRAKAAGSKIVWTVHELNIPETRYKKIDKLSIKLIGKVCDAIVAHGHDAKEKIIASACPSTPEKVKVIPHGHFIDVTENTTSRGAARDELGLNDSEFVILFFGLIRPYKGTLDLVKAFQKLRLKNAKLVIVGHSVMHHKECVDYMDQINRAIDSDQSVKLIFEFIPAERIQTFMHASDIVAFPYLDIMTSGALIMAMGFAKPCIAPRIGCIGETLDEQGAFLYDVGDLDGLTRCIRSAYLDREGLQKMGEHNLGLARDLDWESIAGKTKEVYESCITVRV